jgi:hypothetical protein
VGHGVLQKDAEDLEDGMPVHPNQNVRGVLHVNGPGVLESPNRLGDQVDNENLLFRTGKLRTGALQQPVDQALQLLAALPASFKHLVGQLLRQISPMYLERPKCSHHHREGRLQLVRDHRQEHVLGVLGFSHGVDGLCVRECQARVLRQGEQRLLLALVEPAVLFVGSDNKASCHDSVFVHRCRHGHLQMVGHEPGDGIGRRLVGVDDDQTLFDDGLAAGSLPDRSSPNRLQNFVRDAVRRNDERVRRIGGVDHAKSRHLNTHQLAGACRDAVKHLLQGSAMGDRTLDPRQPIQEPLPLQHGEREREDACHSSQQVSFLNREVALSRTSEDELRWLSVLDGNHDDGAHPNARDHGVLPDAVGERDEVIGRDPSRRESHRRNHRAIPHDRAHLGLKGLRRALDGSAGRGRLVLEGGHGSEELR